MISRKRIGLVGLVWLASFGFALLFAGCSGKEHGRHEPNIDPDTRISFGPKEESRTYYKVEAYWYGTDADGTIDHYEVALVKGLSGDSIAHLDYDALAWTATTRTDSSFVLSADSCCATEGTTHYALSYWGILVRSVDNEGGVDPTPASLFFQASNALPAVTVTTPHKSTTDFLLVNAHFLLDWRGEDSDGDVTKLQYKYLVIPESQLPGGIWLPDKGHRPSLPPLDQDSSGVGHAAPPAGYWSKWVPADCTYVKDLNLSLYAGGQKVVIFLTCKDEGGAVLPDYLYGIYNGDKNWVRLLVNPVPAGVPVRIEGGPLGVRSSLEPTGERGYTQNVAGLFNGSTASFRFWGIEDRSAGNLASAFRYYYDDPEDPRTSAWNYWTSTEPIRDRALSPEWTVKYPPPDGKPFVPTIGPHVFVAEVRDLNNVVTHCEFRIEVLPGPLGKPKLIYLVDDDQDKVLSESPYLGFKAASQAFWTDVLGGYTWERFDTGVKYDHDVPVRRVGDASTVIWLADYDEDGPLTQLLRVCYDRGNYLNSYVKVGGNLIIIGKDPVFDTMYWPDQQIYDPDKRGQYSNWDFTPRQNTADSTYIYNFMYEAFGIVKMSLAGLEASFNTIQPCEEGWQPISTSLIPGVDGWPGRIDNSVFINEVRHDITVHKLYSIIPIDSNGNPTGPASCEDGQTMKLIGVRVDGDGVRGNAVYIGVPPWFFDHDGIKILIRTLLDEFGEPRTQ